MIELAALMAPTARKLLGDPPSVRGEEWRYGAKGSMRVDVCKGVFDDYEADIHGGVLDLIQHRGEARSRAEAMEWLERSGIKPIEAKNGARVQVGRSIFYEYLDAAGETVLFKVERRPKGSRPPFFQYAPDGKGGFFTGKNCMRGVLLVLYQLPGLIAAPMDENIYYCEGEKDADRLRSLGLVATTNPGGAGKFAAVTDCIAEYLRGRRVVLLQDNDQAGANHVAKGLEVLSGVALKAAPLLLEPLRHKGDVSDWLDAGGTVEDLCRLADEALAAPAQTQPANQAPTGRPVIQIDPGRLDEIATEAEAALIAAGAPLYVRGGIVKPAVDDVAASYGRRTKAARLVQVDADCMVDHLCRVVAFHKFNVRRGDYVPTDPPYVLARTILSRDGEWKLPPLVGVITSPTLRPDGTVLTQPGYDLQTRLLLIDPPELPAIPDRPTRPQALAALDLLDRLLDGFPFVDRASRAVALSMLITPVVRGAMLVAPLHAASAPVAGTGKSHLVDVAAAIHTGERAPVLSIGRTEEETEKRLTAALLAGQALVSIDNVNGDLGGDFLCQAVERPLLSVRPLGVSKLVKIESRATLYATGNNIALTGDMTRRAILCSLDPELERPELRVFDFDPLALVAADRGKYIAAALTVCRAYAVEGFPGELPPLASFGEWSRLVRSALVWLGCADPVDTMETARGEDPELSDLGALLASWYDGVGTGTYTAGEVSERARTTNTFGQYIHPDLREALLAVANDGRGSIEPKRLGSYLKRHQGRIVDGLRVVCGEDKHAKQRNWRVVPP